MVLLLFQFSNGKWVFKNVTNVNTEVTIGSEDYYGYNNGKWGTKNDINGNTTTDYYYEYTTTTEDTIQANFQKCIDEGGELLGRLKKICIKKEYKDEMQWADYQFMDGTGLYIRILNFQVIQIDTHSITVSMKIEIEWWEDRLDLNALEDRIIYLSMEDKKEIWSPQIGIANNMVSETRNSEEVGFFKKWGVENYLTLYLTGKKTFKLSTTVKCDMVFQNFPFDDHVCEIEVS